MECLHHWKVFVPKILGNYSQRKEVGRAGMGWPSQIGLRVEEARVGTRTSAS